MSQAASRAAFTAGYAVDRASAALATPLALLEVVARAVAVFINERLGVRLWGRPLLRV